ncbi:hypothetical protein HG531_006755 [Fusarium graminearum]|nr:hypothetical protein HG531_006755 [Fusarium graminearum]
MWNLRTKSSENWRYRAHSGPGDPHIPIYPIPNHSKISGQLATTLIFILSSVLALLLLERLIQSKSLASAVSSNGAIRIGLGDELLAAGVDQKADEIRAHVVACKVSEDLSEMALVEININKEKTIKVLLRLDNEAAVGSSPGTGLNGILRSDQVRGWVSIVGGWVGVNLALLARVDRPCGDVNLLTSRDVERLEEGVHVLPAVELTNTANLSLTDRHESVASSITVDELLDVSGLDLAAVVDDSTVRTDQNLGQVESGVVNLRESQRDKDLVIASSASDAAHLFRVDSHGVLTVSLEHREGLEVGDLPHPVGISRNPCDVSNKLASSLTSFVDEVNGLANTALEIEPLDTVSQCIGVSMVMYSLQVRR